MEGLDWAAGCGPLSDEFTGLSDIRCILDFLIGQGLLVTSDAPAAEVASWLKGNA